ncbi:MAG: TonB-dependent receptor [Sulfuritalea sp.]|nr:TonB-dependent receptor [Sulfuritalea sp.]
MLLLVVLAAPAMAQEVSEKDYFADLPVVLSVSRLAQPLNEVPGAVTVIDRELIRRSGAREVAEVLRLVPGFLFTARNGANPQAAYHSGMDTYGARMQVYVDGRSLYSSALFGDTNLGLRGIVLEDIERIEVLRGSNSASYGANAFLGVINIVTRNAADTHGGMLSATVGDKGVNDNVARVGWGDEKASFRLTGSRRVDKGINNVYDDSHISRVQFRGDFLPSLRDEVTLQMGAGETARGDGAGTAGNPFRTIGQSDVFLLLRWQRQLAADEKLELRVTHGRESFASQVMVSGLGMTALSASDASVERTELGLQHSRAFNAKWRLAWGGEWRHEALHSPSLYFTEDTISLHNWRVFTTVEWRPHDQWLLQASGMEEGHSYTGSKFSPRLAANFHVTPDHTLRAGVTKSWRTPAFYELRADSRLFNQAPGVVLLGLFPVPVGTQAPVVGWPYLSSGTVRAESLISHEVGYLGYIRQANLRIDARAFVERINDRIMAETRTIPNPAYPLLPYTSYDFVNRPGPHLHGFEYQFDWRPLPDTRLILSEMHIRSEIGSAADEAREAPFRNTALTWLQSLPGGFEFSAISTASTPFKWSGGDLINTPRRLDVRLGKPFALGATRGELSVTVQAINGGSQIYQLNQRFDRRAFATLRLNF